MHRCVAVSQPTTITTTTLQRQPCETNRAKDCCGTTSYNKTSKPTSINQFFRLIPPYRSSSNSFPCGSSSSCPTGRSKRRNQTAEPYQSGSNHRTCGTRGWADWVRTATYSNKLSITSTQTQRTSLNPRSPLTVVTGYITTLKERQRSQAEERDHIGLRKILHDLRLPVLADGSIAPEHHREESDGLGDREQQVKDQSATKNVIETGRWEKLSSSSIGKMVA